MKQILLFLFLLQGAYSVSVAQNKYVVFFRDKANNPYSVNNPQDYLSQRAIDRRVRQNISIDETDVPVTPQYVQEVENKGSRILTRSKWFNWVTVECDSQTASTISKLNVVAEVRQVFGKHSSFRLQPGEYAKIKETASVSATEYGGAYNQLKMLGGDFLHNKGFKGQGMLIAVLDAGFRRLDSLAVFDSLRANNQIKGVFDFVELDGNVYEYSTSGHGSSVLSCIGGNMPGTMIGTAPKADFWLLQSEFAPSEYIIEEYNWVSAAEFADSAGVDVINSSLGYTQFDDTTQDHAYQDMNGEVAPSTLGADMAMSKGMIVVNSAGNEGGSSWYYIGAPADGKKVMAVGAVDSARTIAGFSSHGPTADGRVKPNVCAQGQDAFVAGSNGSFGPGSGTSFASPIMAGMVACFWQAFPNLTNVQVVDMIQRSADHYFNPDGSYGYGIPNFEIAYNLAYTGVAPQAHSTTKNISIYPNPFEHSMTLSYKAGDENKLSLKIYNIFGKEVFSQERVVQANIVNRIQVTVTETLPKGIYLLSAQSGSQFMAEMITKN